MLVEARDRLGGRTYTKDHDGHPMEFGGTWVHPLQPHVWSEVDRYAVETETFPVLEGLRQAVVSDGSVVDLSDEDVERALEAFDEFCAPGMSLFPEPFLETVSSDPDGLGGRSMRDLLDSFKAEPVLHDWVEGMCCLVAFGPLEKSGASEIFRCHALAGYSAAQAMAALSQTKLVKGTRELINSIAGQATLADIRLNSPVQRVIQSGDGVRVELENGEAVSAPTALIALPMNVLNSVKFEPELSEIKRIAPADRHAGACEEVLRPRQGRHRQREHRGPRGPCGELRGHLHPRLGRLVADRVLRQPGQAADEPVRRRPGHADSAAAAPAGRRGGEHRRLGLGGDPLALGTWCIFRPGQLAKVLPDLRTTEGRSCSSRAPTRRPCGAVSSTGRSRAATAPPATSTPT